MSGGRRTSTDAWQKPPSASVPNELVIYGRDGDKKKIIDLLLTEEASQYETNFQVVPIVGMGGIGKTTLAQHVFQDEVVKEWFSTKAWACVSDDFDVMRISKAILESVTSHPCDFKEYSQVQVKLREALAGKKFLLVLDDVWNKNYGLWVALKTPFAAGKPGSKIILTTRDSDVALMVGPPEYHRLTPLSDQDCWSVFVKHAFENRDLDAQTNLHSVCERIVTKCKGLPLAARTLGGLLRSKQREDEWEDILNSKIWDLSDSQSDILPVLRLSYYHLPSHLKRCFTYSALIPKGFEFEEKDLVLLWMAEGLVPQQEQNKQMEDLGAEYFRDLVSRSLFQVSSSDESRFVMHDLVSDLAQWAAGDTCFQLGNDLNAIKQFKVSKRARHSSYIRGRDGIRKFEVFHTTKRLRTFLSLPFLVVHACYLTSHVLYDLLPELEFLRVLSLSGHYIDTLPDSIGDLKHLRFLNLSFTAIRNLPQSVCSLYNLQTLLLKGCRLLEGLPSKLGSLINLRHLDITSASSIKAMPMGIEKLTNLQTLSNFVMGKDKGSRLSSLANLKSLRGTLCITGLENVIDAREAMEANIKDINNLEVLLLEWSPGTDSSRNEKVDKDVLDDLRPHGKVKELTINCYPGLTFPTWVGNPSFSSMFLLRLENCTKCTSLPPLGLLPSLKKLIIVSLTAVKKVGPEFYGQGCSKPFPVLETLLFKNMQEWEEWIPCGVGFDEFPLLNELSVTRCPNLCKKLPPGVPSLEKLVIDECEQLVVSIHSLPKLCKMVINGCKEVVYEGGVYLRSLNSMTISNISKLTCLTEGFIQPLAEVQELEVANCMELASLYENGVALTKQEGEVPVYMQQQLANCKLESLTLSTCKSLKKLPQWVHSLVSLKELKIRRCPRLLSFPEAGLPSTLRHISIRSCFNLRSLPEGLHKLCHLREISIGHCPALVSFAAEGLPINLRRLFIMKCDRLKAIPGHMHNLMSLEELSIFNCPGIVSFPEEGFPTSLTFLATIDLKICELLFNWGMHKLTALRTLIIQGGCSHISFPSVDMGVRLPSTLNRLIIEDFPNLEYLSYSGFQNLSSLEDLRISDCPKLTSFPGKGLPSSLLELSIQACPLLVRQIKGRVKEWHKIRHIPYINIDYKVISDPATQVYLSI
ncbi:disease resistance RPP13-like protein 1 [Populus alba x Populus x berolinensis]|nr:disease resistance RPP13-like protein 1 [Populus alba x Populus x berolinensis]